MADESLWSILFSVVTNQFDVLRKGNLEGSVYRVFAKEPVPLYDTPTQGMNVMRRVRPGSLVVGYSDPGEMRQVNTADQYFGYFKRTVKLLPVRGIHPDLLYDQEWRTEVESALPPLDEMSAAYEAEQLRIKRGQQLFMAGFIVVLILGILSVLLFSPPKKVKKAQIQPAHAQTLLASSGFSSWRGAGPAV